MVFTGLEAFLQLLPTATGCLTNDSFWAPAIGRLPFNLHKADRQAGGLYAPDWQPKEVRQGRGAIRGSSQELHTDQVLLLAVVVSACARNIVQVFPEES